MSMLDRLRGLLRRRATPERNVAVDNLVAAYGLEQKEGDRLTQSLALNSMTSKLLHQQRWEEALKAATEAHRLYPTGWAALANKATALLKLDRNEEALEALTVALERNPIESSLRMQKGIALIGVNRPEEGLRCLSEALEQSPNSPFAANAIYFKAVAYQRTDRRREAARCFRQYLNVSPNLDEKTRSAVQAEIAQLENS